MTLKTSSRKINPFLNMLGFTVRKNIGIIIVLCIASLLYYPGTFIVNYEGLIVSAENHVNNYLLENFGVTVTVISAMVAVLFNMLNFGFLYKKSSSDVFHAFPLKRSELLLSRLLAGIVSTLIPVLLCYTSFGVLLVFNSWMGSFAALLYYLLHTCLILLVCSTFSMIFVICAGSMFDLGISLIGGNLALIAIGWIFENILDETLVGYSGYGTSNIVYNISPPYFCGVGLTLANDIQDEGITRAGIEFLVRSVIYIAAFTTASLLLYNRRKAEKGGTGYAYKFMYLGCSLLAGICGGQFLGSIFIGNVTDLAFWFFAIAGCLLTTVIYGTVTNRGFKGVGKSLVMGALSAVVLIAVTVFGVTGGFGYTTRVPNIDKIKSATVSVFDEDIPFENPQQILDLHNAILTTDATNYGNDISYRNVKTVTINYKLKNGASMSRQFSVYAPKVADEMLDIYKSDERLAMIKQQMNYTDAQEINLWFNYENEYYSVNISKSETQGFLDAYWQDVQNSDESVFGDANYEFIELSGYKRIDSYRQNYFHFQLEYHNSFTNTKQFIEQNSLVDRAKAQEENYDK